MPTFLISWFDTAEFLCEQNVYKIVCGCMCLQGVKKIFIEKKSSPPIPGNQCQRKVWFVPKSSQQVSFYKSSEI